MIPNVCIRGSKEHAATVIKFLEGLGGENSLGLEGDVVEGLYYVNSERVIRLGAEDMKHEITLQQAQDILGGKATLREDGTIEYIKTPEFPRMMWTWDSEVKHAMQREIHGHIQTLKYPWIDDGGYSWQYASDTDPRILELSIEEAEEKFNIKIKRQ